LGLARLLFAISSRGGTGTVIIDAPAAARVELQRGFVYALAPQGGQARGEDALRQLLKQIDAAAGGPSVRFDEGASPTHRGRVTPFHPAAILRNHFESVLPDGAGRAVRQRAGDGRLRLRVTPHPSCLGPDEKQLIALLASGAPAGRTVAELDAARVAVPMRIDRLLSFLAAAEALVLDGDGPSPYQLLGLPEGATVDEVRRAYKRLARTVHPDLHPDVADGDRRALELRFTAITDAYRALLDSE
jgi:hypothetical protein